MCSLGNNPTSKSPPAAHQNRSGSLWIHPSWLWIHPSWLLFHPSWLWFHPGWSCQTNLDPLPLLYLSPPPATCLLHFSTYNHQDTIIDTCNALQCVTIFLQIGTWISPSAWSLTSSSALDWTTNPCLALPAFKITLYETHTALENTLPLR